MTIQAQILELLRELQNTETWRMMLITHDLGVVAENADVVAVMFAGRDRVNMAACMTSSIVRCTRTRAGLLKSMPVRGQRAQRLPTVRDGATIPEDFPAGYNVAPHDPDPDPAGGYGGPHAQLHEVEPDHWVLCTAKRDDAPSLAFHAWHSDVKQQHPCDRHKPKLKSKPKSKPASPAARGLARSPTCRATAKPQAAMK